MKIKTIGVINGPNLDRLGEREPEIYGTQTLQDLEKMLQAEAKESGATLLFFQSNHEGEIIDKISECAEKKVDGVIINPGAYSHTSIAIYDAILGTQIPFIEVHISNVYKRERFRHYSYTKAASTGSIVGLGLEGYVLALKYLMKECI